MNPVITSRAGPAHSSTVNALAISPDGKLLLTLGKSGGGRDPEYFWEPNAVVTAPNGDVYVAEAPALL